MANYSLEKQAVQTEAAAKQSSTGLCCPALRGKQVAALAVDEKVLAAEDDERNDADLVTSLDRQMADDLRSDLQAIHNILSEIGGSGSYALQSTVAMRAWAVGEPATVEAAGF